MMIYRCKSLSREMEIKYENEVDENSYEMDIEISDEESEAD